MLTFLAGVTCGIWGKSFAQAMWTRVRAYIDNEAKRLGW